MVYLRCVFALFVALSVCDGLKNLKVTRNIDLRSPVTRVEFEIRVNDGTSDYEFILSSSEESTLSWLGATVCLKDFLNFFKV